MGDPHLMLRPLLEILKCLSPWDTRFFGSYVCKGWLKAYTNRELWIFYFTNEYPLEDFTGGTSKEIQKRYFELSSAREMLIYCEPDKKMLHIFNGRISHKNNKPCDFELKYTCPSWCLLGMRMVFLCGGFDIHNSRADNSREAITVNLDTKEVKHLAFMQHGRYRHSTLRYRNYVYVIGGRIRSNPNSCEKYNMETNQWKSIANLPTSRYNCTPTLWNHRVFVVGGGAHNIDVLSLADDTFLTLEMPLPEPLSLCSGVTFHTEDFLWLVYGSGIYMMDPDRGTEWKKVASTSSEPWYSPCMVVVTATKASFVSDFGLFQMSFQNYEISRYNQNGSICPSF